MQITAEELDAMSLGGVRVHLNAEWIGQPAMGAVSDPGWHVGERVGSVAFDLVHLDD
jgi:hypothetical protein